MHVLCAFRLSSQIQITNQQPEKPKQKSTTHLNDDTIGQLVCGEQRERIARVDIYVERGNYRVTDQILDQCLNPPVLDALFKEIYIFHNMLNNGLCMN